MGKHISGAIINHACCTCVIYVTVSSLWEQWSCFKEMWRHLGGRKRNR